MGSWLGQSHGSYHFSCAHSFTCPSALEGSGLQCVCGKSGSLGSQPPLDSQKRASLVSTSLVLCKLRMGQVQPQKTRANCFVSGEVKMGIQAWSLLGPPPGSPAGRLQQVSAAHDLGRPPHPPGAVLLAESPLPSPLPSHMVAALSPYSFGLGQRLIAALGWPATVPFSGVWPFRQARGPGRQLGLCPISHQLGSLKTFLPTYKQPVFWPMAMSWEEKDPCFSLLGLKHRQGSWAVIRWPFSVCFWVQAVGEADSQEVKPGTASWGPRVVLSPGCTPSSCQTLARAVDLVSVLQWSSMSPCPVPVPGQHSAWPSSSSTREWTWCPEVKVGAEGALGFHSQTEVLVPALRCDSGQITSVSSTGRWE